MFLGASATLTTVGNELVASETAVEMAQRYDKTDMVQLIVNAGEMSVPGRLVFPCLCQPLVSFFPPAFVSGVGSVAMCSGSDSCRLAVLFAVNNILVPWYALLGSIQSKDVE